MASGSDNLNDSERVILDLRPHWWFMASQTGALVLGIVVGLAVLFALDAPRLLNLFVAVGILGLLGWFLGRYLIWTSTRFIVTTDRLIKRSGVFRRQSIEILLERVNTVFFEQRFTQRLLGSGNLVIESAGEQGSQLVENIRQPLKVQTEINRQIEDNGNRPFDRIGRNVAAAGGGDSIPDQIAQLADLYRQGVLTEQEFQSKKKELLDRL